MKKNDKRHGQDLNLQCLAASVLSFSCLMKLRSLLRDRRNTGLCDRGKFLMK